MPKSHAQLDAEIAEALQNQGHFSKLIARIERAVDAHPELTRKRPGDRGFEEAELSFQHGQWTARCACRNKLSKGKNSRHMSGAMAQGATPEEAVDKLV